MAKLILHPGKERSVPVSYTHLDVYKRQEQLLRAYRSRKAALTDTASPVSAIVGVAK